MIMVSGPKNALQKILAMLMVKNVGQGTSVFHHSNQAENFWGSPRTPTIRIPTIGALYSLFELHM